MTASRTLVKVIRATGGLGAIAPLALAAFACGGSSTTGPGGSSGKARYYMTASVDGAAWAEDDLQASITGARLVGPGLYTISGFSTPTATTVLLTLNTIRGPGTYPLGVNFGVPGGTAQVSNTSSGWTTRLSGAAGSITVTLLTQTEIAGTFTFVANGILNAPATSTKNVTSGTFDLPVIAVQAVGPIPDNAGSTISGTLAGQPFTMATVAVTTGQTRNAMGQVIGTTLIFGGSNDTQGMGAAISGITGIGTYALTNKSPTSTMNASVTNGSVIQMWNSGTIEGAGSVTITSWSPTRAKGTFSATLPGAAGGSAVTISGAFDVGLP
jgi:uncharacterized protein DUF6252